MTGSRFDHVANLFHEAACRDNQHDGPEKGWPCNEFALAALAPLTAPEPPADYRLAQAMRLRDGVRVPGPVHALNPRAVYAGAPTVCGRKVTRLISSRVWNGHADAVTCPECARLLAAGRVRAVRGRR